MILPVFVLFGVLSVLFLGEKSCSKPNVLMLSAIFIMMLLIITFRPIEMPDAENYIRNFEYSLIGERFEPGYQLIRNIARSISNDYQVLFGIVGAVALTIKFKAIRSISPLFYGSLLVYLSYCFVLHDMIQIRAGIAAGFILFAIKYIADRDLKRFLVINTIAICFHYSSFAILLLWFLPKLRVPRFIWIFIIPACYVLVFAGLSFGNLISFIPIDAIQYLLSSHQNNMEAGVGAEINIFNLLTVARVLICTYLIYFSNAISRYFPSFKIWLMVYTLSIVILLLFSDIPVVAFRLSELFQISEFIVIPLMAYTLKNRIIGKMLVIAVAISMLTIITFFNQFLL